MKALTLLYGVLIAGFLTTAQAAEIPNREVKSDSLRFLQELRSKNVKRLHEINESLKQKESNSAEAARLKAAQHEHLLRQDFLDRLIFQIDTKFRGGDLREFLRQTMQEMARVDAISSSKTSLWKFLRYASDALQRLPERKEDALAFLEGYMNRSVSNPVRPEVYLASRNYTNGAMSEAGSPVSREEIGLVVDRRLRQLKQQQQTPTIQFR